MNENNTPAAQAGMRAAPANEGLPRKIIRLKASGIEFIGDPHLTCARPGRRIEEDFLSVGLDKVTQARQIAEEKDLLMVFLGDLVDNPTQYKSGTKKVVENTNKILAGFAKAMGSRVGFTIPGNHDKEEVRLTEGTTLDTIRELGILHVVEPGGPFAIVEIGDKKVGLGGTPYGEIIPKDVRGVFGEPVDRVIWITHSQFEFDIKNPFLDKVFEIKGCDMVVNGHDHTTMKPQCVHDTWWFNPGNLLRMSVDCANHKPSVWEWNPDMPPGGMVQHPLKVNELVFNMQGLQVQADIGAAHAQEQEREQSLFSELLMADNGSEMDRTIGGDLLEMDIENYISETPALSEAAQLALRNLHKRAPERLKM